MMMKKMKMETCQSTTWTPAMMTSQLRKRAAARVHPVPARPRAPPAPVHGRGPGKRVQVKGNSGQNVSISSIFLLIYWSTSITCHALLICCFLFFLTPSPSVVLETSCADWMIVLDNRFCVFVLKRLRVQMKGMHCSYCSLETHLLSVNSPAPFWWSWSIQLLVFSSLYFLG